jgi:hypothetical protein
MAHVRETPPLRETTEIVTPSGTRYRWASDEYRAADIPTGDRWSDTMPGGYETHDVTLPRKPGIDYSDLERLSTITRHSASGEIIWQGRLERAPRVSGDQVAISPSAVGWQAHLEDDKSARMIYIDQSLTNWSEPSAQRRIDLAEASNGYQAGAAGQDQTNNLPAFITRLTQPWAANTASEALYDAHGIEIGAIYYDVLAASVTNPADANWIWGLGVAQQDDISTTDTSGDLSTTANRLGYFTPTNTTYTFAFLQQFYSAASTSTAGLEFPVSWRKLTVYGAHGLTRRGTDDPAGFYDADIIGHAISQWCPLLTTSTESLSASTFVIPQMAFLDPTTAGEIVRQATRFGLRDWAVWNDKTFWLHDRGARGRTWRAQVGPAQLEETGPQVDRLWNSIIVAYQDVDGSTRTVGPVGSGADTEDDVLSDDDPENPANKLGIVRRDMLSMGTSTVAGATEIGRQFLEQSKLLDTSGRAVIVGTVQDDKGVLHPYSHMHAGDTIVFSDASDTSARRIVRTEKNRSDRSCSIDLDSPPEGLDALLERLAVVLVPLGL